MSPDQTIINPHDQSFIYPPPAASRIGYQTRSAIDRDLHSPEAAQVGVTAHVCAAEGQNA